MPRHQPTLSVCAVCGAYEGCLTTDCPGSKVDFDRQQEICETALDFTDERGWHLSATMKRPHSTTMRLPPETPRVDSRAVIAPSINWATIDRHVLLQHELMQKALAWALADRTAADHAAVLTRLEDEIDAKSLRRETAAVLLPVSAKTYLRVPGPSLRPDEHPRALLDQLEHERTEFHLASAHAEKCDEEFRQAARTLVAALEGSQVVPRGDEMLFTRTCGCMVVAGNACPHFVAAGGAATKDPAL